MEPALTFDEVFGACCRKFDAPEVWSPEMFRDELIGDLLQALPHPLLNYDRWVLELDPKESNRRQLFGEQATAFDSVLMPEESETDNTAQVRVPDRESNPRIIAQPDTDKVQAPEPEYAPVDKAQTPATSPRKNPVIPPYQPDNQLESVLPIPEMECLHFSQTGLEPVSSVWEISPMQDDIEHLQTMAFRLAFELAEIMGCDNDLLSASDEESVGFYLADTQQFHPFSRLLLSLTGEPATDNSELTLTTLLLGTARQEDVPLLDDVQTVKFLRLIRVIRRLRELQRQIAPETIAV
ncbi:hypothetical protein [Xenorhabdus siamensis]|uniref:hypothetical protein n=1 Tax=Xenorhabdus siamensis TaxID=3136254 RepID=UPI0030F3AFE9